MKMRKRRRNMDSEYTKNGKSGKSGINLQSIKIFFYQLSPSILAHILAHICRALHSLPDVLNAKCQGVLQLVDDLIRHTLASYPHSKGKWELCHLTPLDSKVVGVAKLTLIAEDLVADKKESISLLRGLHTTIIGQV